MAGYLVRDKESKVVSGLFFAPSVSFLFDIIDHEGNPFGFEYLPFDFGGLWWHNPKTAPKLELAPLTQEAEDAMDYGTNDWGKDASEDSFLSNMLERSRGKSWKQFQRKHMY